jgi:hypothetical protein
MECAHDELEFNASLINIEQPPFRFVRVRARCVACYEFFHWRGIASGHPNPEEPVVSADGYELRAPIVAGPGAVRSSSPLSSSSGSPGTSVVAAGYDDREPSFACLQGRHDDCLGYGYSPSRMQASSCPCDCGHTGERALEEFRKYPSGGMSRPRTIP